MTDNDTIITTAQAAAIIGVTDRTITRWADSGDLPIVGRTVGGARRFNRSEVEACRDRKLAERNPP